MVKAVYLFIAAFVLIRSTAFGDNSIIAYTDTNATAGTAPNNLNIGHQFSVTGTGITITDLGVWDNDDDGLITGHAVTLFQINSGAGAANADVTAITGGSVFVPSGTSATLVDGFRFTDLAAPLFLAPGDYSVIAYGLNSSGLDPYGDNGGLPVGPNVTDINFDPFEFAPDSSPAYPTGGAAVDFSSASFLYTVPEPSTFALLGLGLLSAFTFRRRKFAVVAAV
jgi:hypothetical protein